MREAGCEALASSDELALMGLAKTWRHPPRLLRLRRGLLGGVARRRLAVFVGIDAPEFNLGVARRLKADGIPTVQYVSPQVWARRQGRVRGIAVACDRILRLLPFEPPFYARHGVSARFVGHPARRPVSASRPTAPGRARRSGLPMTRRWWRSCRAAALVRRRDSPSRSSALPPGSRHADPARASSRRSPMRRPGPASRPCSRRPPLRAAGARVQVVEGQSRVGVSAAADVVLGIGHGDLETLLTRRPMVVLSACAADRLPAATAATREGDHFAQPNLLVGAKWYRSSSGGGDARRRWALRCCAGSSSRSPARNCVWPSQTVHRDLRRGGADLAARGGARTAAGERARRRIDAEASTTGESTMGVIGRLRSTSSPASMRRVAGRSRGRSWRPRLLDPLARPVDGTRHRLQALDAGSSVRELAPRIRQHAHRLGRRHGESPRRSTPSTSCRRPCWRCAARCLRSPCARCIRGGRQPLCASARVSKGSLGAWRSSRATAKVAAISAASILAKTLRDHVMEQLDTRYPGYGFAIHKGYPVRRTWRRSMRSARVRVHRRSYAPVRSRLR
jgi:lipid-A-disaccharide synthase